MLISKALISFEAVALTSQDPVTAQRLHFLILSLWYVVSTHVILGSPILDHSLAFSLISEPPF